VEVLSPPTEATDRREKLVAYQEIPTLRGYLLLDSEAVGGEYYRKDEDGRWWRTELSSHSVVQVDCLATALDLREVYEGLWSRR
jgi:Uma2 family endonuclease